MLLLLIIMMMIIRLSGLIRRDQMPSFDYNIVVDTREQLPLWKTRVVSKKLDVGDYSIEGFEDKISIERKSLADLFGTLGKGHKRFKKEIERASEHDFFCVVIEGSLTSCLEKSFEGAYHTKMKGYVILSILCTIMLKYNVPFFFTNGRVESKRLIKNILNSYYKIKTFK